MKRKAFGCLPHGNSLLVSACEFGDSVGAAQLLDDFSGGREGYHVCNDIPNNMENQEPKSFLSQNVWNSAELGMAARGEPPDLNTAHRMLVLRTWAGLGGHGNQTAFAIKHGFTVKQWNNFERGAPLSKEAAIQLVQEFPGITLDWLHLGNWDTLSGKLRRELEEAESFLPSKAAGRRR